MLRHSRAHWRAGDWVDNAGRVARIGELDEVIGAWTAQRSVDAVLCALDAASVPAGCIYTVADIAADPQQIQALRDRGIVNGAST